MLAGSHQGNAMLTPKEVIRAFDAIGDRVMHVQVLKHQLSTEGHDQDDIAAAIESAIENGLLSLASGGLIQRPEPASVVRLRLRLTSGERAYFAHGHADGTWLVAEDNGRLLAAAGTPHPTPTQIIKVGQSDSVAQIAADIAQWARSRFGDDVTIESL